MVNLETKESLVVAPSAVPAVPVVSGYGTNYSSDDRVHLRDYWQPIRKHLWLVIGLTSLVTALVTVVLLRKPNIYEAAALVQVDMEEINPALGAASKNNPVVVNNSTSDPAYFNTQLRILSSAGLIRRVVKTLDLENNQDFLKPMVSLQNVKWYQDLRQWMGAANNTEDHQDKQGQKEGEVPTPLPVIAASNLAVAANAPDTAMVEEARRLAPYVKEMLEDLKVEPVVERRLGYARDNTRLIEITFTHRDPQLAAKAANNIADTFVLFNLERRAETNVSTGDFLQKRVAELQAQIRSSEERLINYARNHQILSLNAEQNTVVERLVGLNRQLLEAENKRKLAEATYLAAQAPGAASALAEEHVARQITEMETRLAEARQRQAQLLVENTEEWPEVKEVKQQINTLQDEIGKARTRSTAVTLKNFETQYQQAFATEKALRKAFDQQRDETLTQNEAAINYRIIQQEIETNKNMLDGLLQRYKENDVVLAGLRNNIHVIDYAVTPDKPVGPRRLQGIGLALIFSLVFSAGLSIFMEYLNNTVSSAEEVERLLNLPVLVTIPSVAGARSNEAHPELLFEAEAGSALAEGYRQLRTSILLSTPGQPPRRLLVTSSLPSEGKTTTAVNLAFCLAQTGNPVLLIDADMRRPRLRKLFNIKNRAGLSSYLSSDMSEGALSGLIHRHGTSQLYVLGAGPVPPNPAELLSSEQMARFLKKLEPHFSHIIIDTPPAASFTDAVVLSAQMDGVLLVSHCGKTPRAALQRTRQLLTAAGAKIFGVVLNQVDARQYSYQYEGYYHYAEQQKHEATGVEIMPAPEVHMLPVSGTADLPTLEFESTAPTAVKANTSVSLTLRPEVQDKEMKFRQACTALANPSPKFRAAAVRSLVALGVDSLARAVREAAPTERRKIGEAIAHSGLAHEALTHLAQGHNNGGTYDAMSLLVVMMKAGEIESLLRAVEEHPDKEARIAAIRLLSLNQRADIISALRYLALNKSLPPEVQSALISAVYPAVPTQQS